MLTQDQIYFLNRICPDTWTYSNNTVNVEGNVDISKKDLTQIPVQFGRINGYFSCSYNKLTTLKNSPYIVKKYFTCSYNELTSLAEGPKEVGGWYSCSGNELINLVGAPEILNDNLYCELNQLTTLEGCPEYIKGNLYCLNNPNLNILYGIGKISYGIWYDNLNDLNEWIIQQAIKKICITGMDILHYIILNKYHDNNTIPSIKHLISPYYFKILDFHIY